MADKQTEWNISYKQLGLIVMSFSLGLVVALLVSNSQGTAVSNFTTTELIGFVLSVILSGASIFLAIAAIALGKSSEQSVINRSDESIRLQTEVFTRTTDALQSIKASTGVTEKRIEDIISGRAGDISRQIAELASDETVTGNIDMKELEEKIRKSITGSLKKDETEEEKLRNRERRDKSRQRREIYEINHNKLLYSFANNKDTKILKLGHGGPSRDTKTKYSRYDAVFENNKGKFAVSTIAPAEEERFRIARIGEMITNLALPLEAEEIVELTLVFFEQEEDGNIINAAKESISLIKEQLKEKIKIIPIKYSDLDTWLNENLL